MSVLVVTKSSSCCAIKGSSAYIGNFENNFSIVTTFKDDKKHDKAVCEICSMYLIKTPKGSMLQLL